jgi:biotin carboxyl carrier protein
VRRAGLRRARLVTNEPDRRRAAQVFIFDASLRSPVLDRSGKAVAVRTTLKLPKLGDAVDKVVIVEILVKVGDRISEGQTLFVAETDKTNVDVPSPAAGSVVELKIAVGDEIATGSPTVAIEV